MARLSELAVAEGQYIGDLPRQACRHLQILPVLFPRAIAIAVTLPGKMYLSQEEEGEGRDGGGGGGRAGELE